MDRETLILDRYWIDIADPGSLPSLPKERGEVNLKNIVVRYGQERESFPYIASSLNLHSN